MKTNHILHLIISLLTAGAWIPVWIIISMVNSSRRAAMKDTSVFSAVLMITVVSVAIALAVSGVLL